MVKISLRLILFCRATWCSYGHDQREIQGASNTSGTSTCRTFLIMLLLKCFSPLFTLMTFVPLKYRCQSCMYHILESGALQAIKYTYGDHLSQLKWFHVLSIMHMLIDGFQYALYWLSWGKTVIIYSIHMVKPRIYATCIYSPWYNFFWISCLLLWMLIPLGQWHVAPNQMSDDFRWRKNKLGQINGLTTKKSQITVAVEMSVLYWDRTKVHAFTYKS